MHKLPSQLSTVRDTFKYYITRFYQVVSSILSNKYITSTKLANSILSKYITDGQ